MTNDMEMTAYSGFNCPDTAEGQRIFDFLSEVVMYRRIFL